MDSLGISYAAPTIALILADSRCDGTFELVDFFLDLTDLLAGEADGRESRLYTATSALDIVTINIINLL